MFLDIVEVTCSHTGVNLAMAFAKILEEFGINDKVNIFCKKRVGLTHQMCPDPLDNL